MPLLAKSSRRSKPTRRGLRCQTEDNSTPMFYDENGIAIHHGNCLDILPTLPSESVDLVITDPPYLVNYQGRWDGERRTIVGDRDGSWVAPAFAEIFRVLKS